VDLDTALELQTVAVEGFLNREAPVSYGVDGTLARMTGSAAFARGVPAGRRRRVARTAAVGVSAREPGDFRVALRVQSPNDAALVSRGASGRLGGGVDVQAVGEIRALTGAMHPFRQSARPLSIGVSIAHQHGDTGSLSLIVEHDGTLRGVSNNHVIARFDNAAAGDPIVQPGPSDASIGAPVGHLATMTPLSRSAPNTVDIADFDLAPGIAANNHVATEGSVVAATGLTPAELVNTDVRKAGRTTGITHGSITAFNTVADIWYPGRVKIRFEDLLEITTTGAGPFSAPGDSGGLVYREVGEQRLEAIAIVIGGSTQRDLCYATPIHHVLDNLGASIAGT
jgi:hypothetical protein